MSSMRFIPTLVISMLCALGLGTPARADEGRAPAPDDLGALTDDELVALAEAGGETILVWAERPEKPFDRDTQRRLSGEELAARGATDLATALALLPDVTVRDAGRGGMQIDIRGARKGAVRVLIDGVAVSDPFYGTFDVSSIPITDIVEIRVSTAPASPIDGPGGPGGVIEVHTRDAIGAPLSVVRLTSNTLPVFGASATGRVALAEQLALRLSASSQFGFHEFDAAGDVEIRDRRRATTGAMRLEHRRGARRVVVDGFADTRRYLSPPSDELAAALFLLIDRELTGRVGIGYDDALGADQKLQLQVRGWTHAMTRMSRNFRDPGLREQVNSEALSSMRVGGVALLTRPIGRLARWIGSVTLDHERARVVTTSIGEVVTTGDATVVEVAAGGQLERGPLELAGAAGLAVPAGIDADPWPEAKLSAKYQRDRGTVEAIVARKGRVPSLRERYQGMGANVALDPEQAWHGELRLTARPRDGISVVVAPYARRTTGTVKVGMDNLLVNLGELVVRGVDVSVQAQLVERVAIGGAYQHATASSDDLGPVPLDFFPAHRADGWVEVRPIPRLRVRARGRYVGDAIDRAQPTPAYLLWELGATASLGDDWLAVLRCDDLLDEAPETRSGYRQPGRTLSLVVQGTWE